MAVTIRRNDRSSTVRREMVRATNQREWEDDRWWKQFLDARANLFAGINRSANPTHEEKLELEGYYIEWVRESRHVWWGQHGEYWLQIPGIVQWLLYQYLRGRKSGGGNDGGPSEEAPAEEHTGGYWDPVRDV